MKDHGDIYRITEPYNRKEFLKKISLIAAGTSLFPLLNSCAVSQSAEESRQFSAAGKDKPNQVLYKLLGLAILAPSGHNTQPWKFKLEQNTIYIYPDYTRRLAVVDPDNRELFISLGCAIENFVIAAETEGFQANINYNLSGNNEFIRISITEDQPRRNDELLDAIKKRQCTRSEYQNKQVPAEDLKKFEKIKQEPGTESIIITDKKQIDNLIELVKAGNEIQMNDDAFYDELQSWIRFSEGEAAEKEDGLYSGCMGNPKVPRWIGKIFMNLFYGSGSQSDDDEKRIKSSSGIVLFTCQNNDKVSWINTGRTYERWALTTTMLNIKSAFINQPVEIPELKNQLSSYLAVEDNKPQLMLRFGYAETMPYSYRRKPESVIL